MLQQKIQIFPDLLCDWLASQSFYTFATCARLASRGDWFKSQFKPIINEGVARSRVSHQPITEVAMFPLNEPTRAHHVQIKFKNNKSQQSKGELILILKDPLRV
jgi:hypothetical protein